MLINISPYIASTYEENLQMNNWNPYKKGRWKSYSDYVEERLEARRKNLNKKIIKIAVLIFTLIICSFVIWFSFT